MKSAAIQKKNRNDKNISNQFKDLLKFNDKHRLIVYKKEEEKVIPKKENIFLKELIPDYKEDVVVKEMIT